MTYEIRALSADTWPAFDDLVVRHNGIFGGCWCIWFHPDGPERGQGAEANRALKRRYVEEGKAHAALVFDGDEAIAWCEFGTPEELPTIHHRKQYDATKGGDPDWRITCIFVDRRYRRQGIAELAMRGALDLIARAGGGVVEGYPHELTDQRRRCRPRSSTTGPVALRAPRLHLRPPQGSEELRHGAEGQCASLSPTTQPTRPSRRSTLTTLIDSSPVAMPKATVRLAPTPTQTAYDVPSGSVRIA